MKIGIIGTGNIAHKMARTINMMHEELYAVASRDKGRAEAFAKETGAAHAYGGYEELAEDGKVDLVYVATPHSEHERCIRLCLERGRNVICEKAFTVNAKEAREVCALAEKEHLLLTEAIWTRYLPSRGLIDALVEEIGEVRMLTANLCYAISGVKRIIEPSLAGGALLDVGVYPLNFMLMHIGDDYDSFTTAATLTDKGVDEQNASVFHYPDGKIGCIQSGTRFPSDRRGLIYGTKGTVEIGNINNPESVRLFGVDRKLVKEVPVPPQLTGFEYEVDSSLKAIREGRSECPEMPHAETIRVMEAMDALRASWGVKYPFE